MQRGSRYAPYLIVLLAFLGLLGWIRYENRRAENFVRESASFAEPSWANACRLSVPRCSDTRQRKPNSRHSLSISPLPIARWTCPCA